MEKIIYIDRESGRQKEEFVPGGRSLKFMYNHPVGQISLNMLLKRKAMSTFAGFYMDLPMSKKGIESFVKKNKVDLGDYEVPEGGFQSFNDFFYRKLKPGKRPLQDGIVSPADGKILAFDNMEAGHRFFVKGRRFSLSDFLGDADLAKKFEGGAMAIVRLAPADYHRFHFPASGFAGPIKRIDGVYHSVSPLALQKSLESFCENKREYCLLDSEGFGKILLCDVGATMVGSIEQTYKPNSHVEKGGEKGYFAFGGSTVVMLFEPQKISFDPDLLANTEAGFETTVKMGARIGFSRAT